MSIDAGESGLGLPENITAAAEITLISFSVTKLYYFRCPSVILNLNFSVNEASG